MKGLKAQIEAEAAVPAKAATRGRPVNPARAMTDEADSGGRVPSRKGKRAIVGHFSQELALKISILARTQGKTIQALMGEAWDDLLVKYGEEPFGEA